MLEECRVRETEKMTLTDYHGAITCHEVKKKFQLAHSHYYDIVDVQNLEKTK